jgi:PAS domain S-box-containing protein
MREKIDEKEFRESLETCQRFMGLCPDAIVVLQDGRYRLVNPAFTALFGYTKQEVDEGLSSVELVRESDREAVQHRYEKRLAGESVPRTYRIDLLAKDGTVIPCETSAALIQYEGRPADLVIIRDISERLEVERKLGESEDKYRRLVETMNEGLAVVDEQMRYTYVNDSFCEMSGYSSDEILGRSVAKLHDKENMKILKEQFAKRRQGGRDSYRLALGRKDGDKVFVLISPRPIFDEDGRFAGSIGVATNITALVRAEDALKRMRDDLEVRIKERTADLSEMNSALRVLLRQREEDKARIEAKVLANTKDLVLPYVNKLKKTRLDANQMSFLKIIESNLSDIVSPFVHQLSSKYLSLSPMEIQVAQLVREGRTTKEIAEVMGSSRRTIESHREKIRVKLGLKNKRVNLQSYLASV